MAHAFEQAWYRVAPLRPRLRLHAQTHRQRARGQVWYVVQDHQSGRHFRISTAAHALLSMMDGSRSVADMFDRLARHRGAERPSRGDTVKLLVQLHQADLLTTPLPPDLAELGRRAERQSSGRVWSHLRNPLAVRIPLWDPDRFLSATLPFGRLLGHRLTALAAIAVALTGAVLAGMHWGELASNVADRVFAADNVLLMAVLYPVAKALHEAGHAYAVKLGGGDVHEVGVMLLVLFPVPYVDASASAAFPDAWRRVLVSAAGILIELVLAGLAAIAWVALDPGPARAAALDIMVLCGVSTVLFNANPLLRFDGYYVLADLLGIPNLDTRARRHVASLARSRLLGMAGQPDVVETPGEGPWLVAFGVLSFAYRMVMVVTIGLIVAAKFFVVGAALAIASVAQMLVLPVLRAGRFLLVGVELKGRRRRALLGAGAAASALALLLLAVPLPHALLAPGVVWVPSESIVRAGADGFVTEIEAAPGATVAAGAALFRLEDPVAAAQLDVLAAEVEVQRARFEAVNLIDLVQARLVAEQLARAEAARALARDRFGDLEAVAGRSGRFVVPDAAKLAGRFVRKGQVLGYVLAGDDIEVRAVVSQADLDLVRSRASGGGVDVRLAERLGDVLPGRIIREIPSALDRAPAGALSPDGGGPMLADPSSPGRDRPLERWYEFDIALPDGRTTPRIGGHATARFDLGDEPLGWRLARGARQLLLRTLSL
jgi:putative peptide zinc metalloprotease protein